MATAICSMSCVGTVALEMCCSRSLQLLQESLAALAAVRPHFPNFPSQTFRIRVAVVSAPFNPLYPHTCKRRARTKRMGGFACRRLGHAGPRRKQYSTGRDLLGLSHARAGARGGEGGARPHKCQTALDFEWLWILSGCSDGGRAGLGIEMAVDAVKST